jgi:hypothetical protein
MPRPKSAVSGHLQLRGGKGSRQWHAYLRVTGVRRHHTLGPAHAKDSGKRTERGAPIWRASSGPKPTPEHLTPKEADDALTALRAAARDELLSPLVPESAVKTLGDARAEWLRHVEFDRARKPSTIRDYASQTRRYLLDELGALRRRDDGFGAR